MSDIDIGQSLPEKILQFGRLLRCEGFTVDPATFQHIIHGLTVIRISEKREFYVLLRAHLVSNQEESQRFGGIFEKFWGTDQQMEDQEPPNENEPEEEELHECLKIEKDMDGEEEAEYIGASLETVTVRKDFSDLNHRELERIEQVLIRIAKRLAHRLARRFKSAKRARQIDFRKTFRQALQFGGDVVELRYRKRRPRNNKVYLLLDISGSMDIYGRFFLLFMYGLQQILQEAETFVFSTRLTCVTDYLKQSTFVKAFSRIQSLSINWSGGTDIGTSLMQFLVERLNYGQDTRSIVIIVSDGWDRGDPDRLEWSMRLIRRRAYKIFWLNPLMGSPEYEPICRGMRTALPHVDFLLPCHNLESLFRVSHRLETAWQEKGSGLHP